MCLDFEIYILDNFCDQEVIRIIEYLSKYIKTELSADLNINTGIKFDLSD